MTIALRLLLRADGGARAVIRDDEFDAECGLHCGFDTGEVA